jgi:uncharacterized membrane protein YcaP (DUF421 family)
MLETLFGTGEHLNPLHMAARALFMFLIALLLIRLGGLRIVGKKSGLDLVIVIMLGAVLARGIVGASPMLSTIAAAAVMISINRLLAWLAIKNKVLSQLLKGKALTLYQNGNINWDNMNRACLSESDLMTSLRLETNQQSLDEVEKAFLETNGRISFVLKYI